MPSQMIISSKRLTASGFLSFFIFGFADNLKGPLLPEMTGNGGLSYSQVGTVFLVGYIGFIVATLGCGLLSDRLGHQRVLHLAAFGLLFGGIGFSSMTTYPLLIIFMGVIGLGLGAIELGGNGLMVELHSATRGRYLNLLGTFHGLGSLTVPLVTAWLLRSGFSWQWIYSSIAVLAILLAVMVWQPKSKDRLSLNRLDVERPSTLGIAFTKQMGLYYLLLSAYVALELGVGAWMIEYLQQDRRMSIATSSLFLSSFFVFILLGRFFGAFLVDAVGHHRAIAISLIGSCTCLAVGIFANATLAMLLPLSGLFMSIIFPTVTASVSAIHKDKVGSVLGILFAFSGVGGAMGPWTVGVVSDWAGIRMGFASTLGFGLVAIVALVCLHSTSVPEKSQVEA